MELANFIELESNMNNQILFFDDVLEINTRFRQSIVEKDWSSVNRNIDLLNELAIEVKKFDSRRVQILISIAKNIKSKESENLLSIIQKAPVELRGHLVDLFYKLKSLVIQIQGVFKGINNYVEYKKDLSKEIIDILVKDSKGNVYSKPGRRESDGQGFLVNRQL